MLTDDRWEELFHLMKSTGRVYEKPEHKPAFEGILYRLRTGIPWRYLPKEFEYWNMVFRRCHIWSKKGVLTHLFKALVNLADI